MADDAQYRPPRTMRLQSTPAKVADGAPPGRPAGNIDFAANSPPQPFIFFRGRCSVQLFNRAHEFMPRNAPEAVIAVQQFHVRIANAHNPHADNHPPGPNLRHRRFLEPAPSILAPTPSQTSIPCVYAP